MAVTTTSKLGKYVCKIGYLDIRHVLVFKKPTEIYICHGKHRIAGPLYNIDEAKSKAQELILQNVKYDMMNQ